MDLGLKDKIAVITGGSAGIGLAIARGLAAEGVHIALCARNAERAAQVARSIINEYGVRAIGVQADISGAADVDSAVSEMEREFGGVDMLINNAGTGSEETILNRPGEGWQYE